MSTKIELEHIHALVRNSFLIHTGMDYVIFSTANAMGKLDPTTDPINLNITTDKPQQITIEDPYFIPKGPIFNFNNTIILLGGKFIEDEFNTGNLPRSLYTLIESISGDQFARMEILQKIKLYTDHTSALFIQTLLSYIILYPEKFLALKNLDNKSRLVTIRDKITEKYKDISNAESESITDFILLLIETFGTSPDPSLIQLLNDMDKNGHHTWLNVNGALKQIPIQDIKKFTNTIDLFHELLNTMNPDLISGIFPYKLAREFKDPASPGPLINDLFRVIIEIHFMEKILDLWKYLLESDNVTPIIISFIKDELPKIFGYFEESEPLPDGEEHVDISRVHVKDYLDTFLNQNIIAKLTELSGRPSSHEMLKLFRSLKINTLDPPDPHVIPDPNVINFLFTVTYILQENPALFTLHRRSHEFEFGWTGTVPNEKVPRWDFSPKIFPGIIFRNGRAKLLESVELEQEYNRLKNEVTDLDLRIGQVGQLQNLLKTARGIPL